VKGIGVFMDVVSRIISVIDNLRPYLMSDGGNIEFVKFEDGIVYIKLQGACVNCSLIDMTLYDGIECVLKDEIPEVKGVINID
jgi:Fe-S cluster biogenesis protein NfuA